MNKECFAEPEKRAYECLKAQYDCYNCKHWKYKEIGVKEEIPSWMYQAASFLAIIVAVIGFWIFLNIFG